MYSLDDFFQRKRLGREEIISGRTGRGRCTVVHSRDTVRREQRWQKKRSEAKTAFICNYLELRGGIYIGLECVNN